MSDYLLSETSDKIILEDGSGFLLLEEVAVLPRHGTPRTSKRNPNPYEIYGLGFLYGTERAIRKSRRDE